MALVESRLAGEHKMRLTSPGNALAERVAKLPHVAEAKLWPMPFEVYLSQARRTPEQQQRAVSEMILYRAVPALKVGRALQFKGQFEGDKGAKAQFLNSRAPDEYIENYRLPPEYTEKVPRSRWAQIEAVQVLRLQAAKQNASLWLGLIFFEQEDYQSAANFLAKRVLEADDKTPWQPSARYNLARAYEAEGDTARAIEVYESDTTGPQSYGNRLRARWLKEQDETNEAAEKPAAEPQSEDAPAVDTEGEETPAKAGES